MRKFIGILLSGVLLLGAVPSLACTSVIVSSRIRPEGALMMKHRDTDHPDNKVLRFKGEKYDFIGIVNVGFESGEVWSGTNSAGFCIMNTATYDLKDDDVPASEMDREGELMYRALGICANTADFEHFLDTLKRPMGVESNFGVIDAFGGASYYEVNNSRWVKFDVNDPSVAPDGYSVVTNFTRTGRPQDRKGTERYKLADRTMQDLLSELSPSKIDHEVLIRRISRGSSMILRDNTSGVYVFEGVPSGTDPKYTVMWTALGSPEYSVAVPLLASFTVPAWMSQHSFAADFMPEADLRDSFKGLYKLWKSGRLTDGEFDASYSRMLDGYRQHYAYAYLPETSEIACRKRIKENPDSETWKDYRSVTADALRNVSGPDRLNRYGSLADGPEFKATGFYRTEKYNGRWIMVDPEGKMHIDALTVGIRPGNGEAQKAAFNEKFKGDINLWIKATADSLASFGFNGAGCWSDTGIIQKYNALSSGRQLSFCPFMGVMASFGRQLKVTVQRPGNTGYPNQCILVFDPRFEQYCEEFIPKFVAPFKGDPNVVGYFSDNEMPLSKANLEGYLNLPENDYGHIAAKEWLDAKGLRREDITDAVRSEFAGYVADRYYSIVSRILKKHDPDHMYLGSRLHGGAKFIPEVVAAAGKYCDIISFNYYGAWTVRRHEIERWKAWADAPFIITEFYTKGEDSGLGNTSGAGWRVRTQNDRGVHYENFIITLLQSSNCVGWSWFRYQDNDPTAKGVDPSNIDANKGCIDNSYNYYQGLVKRMRQINSIRYGLITGREE